MTFALLSRLAQVYRTIGEARGLTVTVGPARAFANWAKRFGVRCVIDAGANRGRFVREIRKFGYAGRICCFEPDPSARGALQSALRTDPLVLVREEALGAEEATRTLQAAGDSVFSSLLPVTEQTAARAPAALPIDRWSVQVRRLDALWRELGLGDVPVAVKIDTQGSDLYVIEGMGGVIEQVAVVLCELSMRPLYEGQPSGRQVIDALEGRGFDLVSLWPVYVDPQSHALVDMDGLFINARMLDLDRASERGPAP